MYRITRISLLNVVMPPPSQTDPNRPNGWQPAVRLVLLQLMSLHGYNSSWSVHQPYWETTADNVVWKTQPETAHVIYGSNTYLPSKLRVQIKDNVADGTMLRTSDTSDKMVFVMQLGLKSIANSF
jgi:hypothetical protein